MLNAYCVTLLNQSMMAFRFLYWQICNSLIQCLHNPKFANFIFQSAYLLSWYLHIGFILKFVPMILNHKCWLFQNTGETWYPFSHAHNDIVLILIWNFLSKIIGYQIIIFIYKIVFRYFFYWNLSKHFSSWNWKVLFFFLTKDRSILPCLYVVLNCNLGSPPNLVGAGNLTSVSILLKFHSYHNLIFWMYPNITLTLLKTRF